MLTQGFLFYDGYTSTYAQKHMVVNALSHTHTHHINIHALRQVVDCFLDPNGIFQFKILSLLGIDT